MLPVLFITLAGSLAGAEGPATDTRERYLVEMDWEAADAHPALPDIGLNRAQSTILSWVDLPVLLPAEFQDASDATVTTGEGWYAFTLHRADHVVAVFGTRVAFHEPGIKTYRPAPEGWNQRMVTRNDGCPEVTFTAFGAAYDVLVICNHTPFEDPMCADDAYIDELGASMSAFRSQEPR